MTYRILGFMMYSDKYAGGEGVESERGIKRFKSIVNPVFHRGNMFWGVCPSNYRRGNGGNVS